ncbi:peptidase M50 [Mycobacterium haemophilum]
MNTADSAPSVAVLLFGDDRTRQRWNALTALSTHRADGPDDIVAIDAAIGPYRRLVVVGGDGDLAAVLGRLLRADRLDIEVAYVPRHRTAATRVYRLPAGRRAARRARRGPATRVPLIRDETGSVIVGKADWLPVDDRQPLHGEAVVDDIPLFDGDVAGVRIAPTLAMPGLRARLHGPRTGLGIWRRWLTGRAVQLGSTGVAVVRDGVPAGRPARRSTLYRNVEGWLLVR